MGIHAAIKTHLRRHWQWARWPLLGFGVLFVLSAAFFMYLGFTVKLPKDLPQVESSIVYDPQGRQTAAFPEHRLRVQVKLDQISPSVVDALISSEDRHFFEHHGVDPIGTVRAFWNDMRGNSVQGGSTITQQLVKNDYLSSDRSLLRKAKEAVLSIKLEGTIDKNEILERYLNTVYFGRGAYGVEAASHVYFNTTAAQLSPAQSALLVGLLSAPESADPS